MSARGRRGGSAGGGVRAGGRPGGDRFAGGRRGGDRFAGGRRGGSAGVGGLAGGRSGGDRIAGFLGAALAALALLLGVGVATASAARPAPVLLSVHRTGGIAGVDDRLVVRTDGRGTVTGRDGDGTALRAADTRAVRAALVASRFATLQPSYGPPGGTTVADGFVVTLRHGGRRVVWTDGAEGVPARLARLVEAAMRLLAV